MQVSVKNQSGDALASIELNDAVFNVPMNPSLVHQAMVIYQGNKRQGTHDTKTRAQVSGGGRKPWIQKHTGRARQGSTRAPSGAMAVWSSDPTLEATGPLCPSV